MHCILHCFGTVVDDDDCDDDVDYTAEVSGHYLSQRTAEVQSDVHFYPVLFVFDSVQQLHTISVVRHRSFDARCTR